MSGEKYYQFYSGIDRTKTYANDVRAEDHSFFPELSAFVKQFGLGESKILEIGSGRGCFQDISTGYHGLDVSEELRKFYKDPDKFSPVADGKRFPFPDNHFDAAFTYAVLEHIPSLETSLSELIRVVKPGGNLLIHAAWQVRPWVSRGLSSRPFRDLTWWDKLEKFTIPIRESILWRGFFLIPVRVLRTIRFIKMRKWDRLRQWKLDYRKLTPNYEIFWESDSDACNQIDIHSALLWFFSRGCKGITYPDLFRAFFARTGSFIVQTDLMTA